MRKGRLRSERSAVLFQPILQQRQLPCQGEGISRRSSKVYSVTATVIFAIFHSRMGLSRSSNLLAGPSGSYRGLTIIDYQYGLFEDSRGMKEPPQRYNNRLSADRPIASSDFHCGFGARRCTCSRPGTPPCYVLTVGAPSSSPRVAVSVRPHRYFFFPSARMDAWPSRGFGLQLESDRRRQNLFRSDLSRCS